MNSMNNTFTDNNAYHGGAISNLGNLNGMYNTYIGNTALDGGTIYNDGGSFAETNSTYTSNTALSYGGAIDNIHWGSITVTGCILTGNSADQGGAFYNAGDATVNFNRILENTATLGNDLYNSGEIDATLNWWGTNTPNNSGNDILNGGGYCVYDPWIVLSINASPISIPISGSSTITADLLHDNHNNLHDPSNGLIPYTGSANFTTNNGTIGNADFNNGIAATTLKVDNQGPVIVSTAVDNQNRNTPVYVGFCVASVNPVNRVPQNNKITITFTDSIEAGSEYNKIYVKDQNGIQQTISTNIYGNTLIITPVNGWEAGQTFTINIPQDAVTNTEGTTLTNTFTSTFTVLANTVYVNNQGNDNWDGQSATWNGTSGPKATIVSALNILSPNGTIELADGTYNEYNIPINYDTTIIGESQIGTIIDSQSLGNIFIVTSDNGINLTLIKMTLENGNAQNNGGAIDYENDNGYYGTLNISYITFNNNTANNNGGAIDASDINLNINNNTFNNNTAENGNGGAIAYTDDETQTLTMNSTNNTFSDNKANNNYGGAIYNDATLNDNNSTYIDNYAQNNGGAIANDWNGIITVTNSTFNTNTAQSGGAIFNSGNAIVNFDRIIGNIADSGNDIFNYGTIDATLNWWGTNTPNKNKNDIVNQGYYCTYDPWIVLSINASPISIPISGSSTITADLLHDNHNNQHDPSNGLVPYTGFANFTTNNGTIQDTKFNNGIATATLNVDINQGPVNVSTTVDNQNTNTPVYVGFCVESVNPVNCVQQDEEITVTFTTPIKAGDNYNDIIALYQNGDQQTILTKIKETL